MFSFIPTCFCSLFFPAKANMFVLHGMTRSALQSRPDRDRYVKVVKDNVETSSLDQFDKRSDNETTSLGYAYDYHSIMHYGNNYYSTSTAHTLVVRIIIIIIIIIIVFVVLFIEWQLILLLAFYSINRSCFSFNII